MNDIECVDSRLDKEAEEAKLISFLTMVGKNSFWVHSNAQKISDACAQAAAMLNEKNRLLFERGAFIPESVKIGLLQARLEEANREKREAESKLQDAFSRGVLAGMKQAGADHGK